MYVPHVVPADTSAQSLLELQARLAETGRERAQVLRDLSDCRQRARHVDGAQRVLREQAYGMHLHVYLAGLEENLLHERQTVDGLQVRLLRIAIERREMISTINHRVHGLERGDTST